MTHEALNYQAKHSAVYYTPPEKVRIGRTALAFGIAAIVAALGAATYGHIQPHLEDLFVRFGAVLVAAFAVGLLGVITAWYGKVQLHFVAAFIGATLAMIAIYSMWLVWVHDVFQRAGLPVRYWPLITHPLALFRLIRYINSVGTWTYHGEMQRGILLLVWWIGEATLMLLCGVFFPLKAVVDEDPTCRTCGSRCRLARPIARFAIDRQDELVAGVHARTFEQLAPFEPPWSQTVPHLSLRLISCPKCAETNMVTVNRLRWLPQGNGQQLDIHPLVNRLLMTREEADALTARGETC